MSAAHPLPMNRNRSTGSARWAACGVVGAVFATGADVIVRHTIKQTPPFTGEGCPRRDSARQKSDTLVRLFAVIEQHLINDGADPGAEGDQEHLPERRNEKQEKA